MQVVVTGGVGALSPAIEVAAYRIAVGDVTNALRHSDATLCTVRITAAPTSPSASPTTAPTAPPDSRESA